MARTLASFDVFLCTPMKAVIADAAEEEALATCRCAGQLVTPAVLTSGDGGVWCRRAWATWGGPVV